MNRTQDDGGFARGAAPQDPGGQRVEDGRRAEQTGNSTSDFALWHGAAKATAPALIRRVVEVLNGAFLIARIAVTAAELPSARPLRVVRELTFTRGLVVASCATWDAGEALVLTVVGGDNVEIRALQHGVDKWLGPRAARV